MGSETFQKRERERKRQERAAQRRERRDARRNNEDEGDGDGQAPVSAEALMEQFRILSEQHASGEIDSETYEAEKAEIFVQLGLSDPFDS